MDSNNYYNNVPYSAAQVENELTLQKYVAAVMRRVYGKMTLGLLTTAVVSFLILSSSTLLQLLFSSKIVLWVLALAELGVVIYLSARIEKLSTATASALFYVYSMLNGVVLAPIFFVFTGASIALTFAITAGTFGAMCIFGYVTKQDLSKIGAILFMALIGLILATVVNLFVGSDTLSMVISWVGVLIFVGLTAWDTQKIKKWAAMSDQSMVGKVATMGALSLYLDFINLFLYLLRIFGRDN